MRQKWSSSADTLTCIQMTLTVLLFDFVCQMTKIVKKIPQKEGESHLETRNHTEQLGNTVHVTRSDMPNN